jgi:dihydrofolate reductase
MRKLIFAINITLDGCCDHTKTITDEEMFEYYTHLMRDVDLLVYGRKTYQLMVPFWPEVAKNHSGQTKAGIVEVSLRAGGGKQIIQAARMYRGRDFQFGA